VELAAGEEPGQADLLQAGTLDDQSDAMGFSRVDDVRPAYPRGPDTSPRSGDFSQWSTSSTP
jgi:hypothetical protein